MNCADFHRELERLLDCRSLCDRSDLEAHRDSCAPCREKWHESRLLADAIASWREPLPEVDLVETVVGSPGLIEYLRRREAPASCLQGRISHPESAGKLARREQALAAAHLAGFHPMRQSRARRPMPVRGRRTLCLIAVLFLGLFLVASQGREGSDRDSGGASMAAHQLRPEDVTLFRQAGTFARGAAGALEGWGWGSVASVKTASTTNDPAPNGSRFFDGLELHLGPIGRSIDNAFDFLWEAGQVPEKSRESGSDSRART